MKRRLSRRRERLGATESAPNCSRACGWCRILPQRPRAADSPTPEARLGPARPRGHTKTNKNKKNLSSSSGKGRPSMDGSEKMSRQPWEHSMANTA